MIEQEQITGIVLCGGQGARLNNEDKPLLKLGERRIIDHILERLIPQVGSIIVSCSRNVALYEALGHEIVVDDEPSSGPLAGMVESFASVTTEWSFSVPGDVPFLAKNLVNLLIPLASANGIAVPKIDNQREHLFLVLNRKKRERLTEYYRSGGRAVRLWLDKTEATSTDVTDLRTNFLNVNTAELLKLATDRVTVSS